MLNNFFLLITFLISQIFFINITFWDDTIKDSLLNISENDMIWSNDNWFNMLNSIFIWLKDSLTWLLILIAVWAFLYIWIKIAISKWNPEEFKKAILHFVYAIVWIFLISIAWALVTLVTWLNP